MMKIRFLALLMFVLGGASGVFAQSQTLSIPNVQSAIATVLAENPDLVSYQLQQEKAAKEYDIQKWSALPTVTGSFGGVYNIDLQSSALPGEVFGRPGETVNVQMGTAYNYNTGLSASMDLFNRQSILQTSIAKLNTEMQVVRTEAYEQKLTEQVILYYYAILLSQQSITNQQKHLVLADSVLQVTEEKFRQGISDLSALNLAKISHNSLKQNLHSLELILKQYQTQFKILLALEPSDSFYLEQKEPILPLHLTTQLKPDKNLQVYKLQILQSEADLKLKRSAFLPKLSANGYLGYQQLRNDFGLSFSENSWTPYNYVGLNLSVPIFNGFTNKGKVKTAKINHLINQQTFETEAQKSKLTDAQVQVDYDNSLVLYKLKQENQKLFQQNADLALVKYEAGIIGADQYFRAFEDHLQAESQTINSLTTVFSNYSKILSRQQ